MQFPLILLRDIPVSKEGLTDTDTVLVVRDNTKTERVPISSFLKHVPICITDIPTTPIAEGAEGSIAWDNTGLYTFANGIWGKTPRLVNNWDDITKTSRFLQVDKPLTLSEREIENVKLSIGLQNATMHVSGTVKITQAIEANDGGVPTGTQVEDYVAQKLSSLMPVSESTNDLENYSGPLLLKGPKGEVLMTYDSTNSTLYIGSSDINVVLRCKDSVQVQDKSHQLIINTQE